MKPIKSIMPPELATDNWSENDSELFINLGRTFTPRREEIERSFLQLIDADVKEKFTVLELGCGSGWLSGAILKNFPNAKIIALDGSQTMLSYAAEQLKDFQNRTTFNIFKLEDPNFLDNIKEEVKFVVSSLVIHHLNCEEKQALFKKIYQKVALKGGLIIFDLVEPVSEIQRKYLQNEFDYIVKKQSQNYEGSMSAYDFFIKHNWNYYAYLNDPIDMPSPLFDQLKWLERAGFSGVDAFYCLAGHALFGGYKF